MRDADGRGLVSRYFNKNMPWVGKQKIVRYKDYFSFCDRSSFCSVVISTIQRIATVSTHANDACDSILQIFNEFRFLNYPENVFKKAV